MNKSPTPANGSADPEFSRFTVPSRHALMQNAMLGFGCDRFHYLWGRGGSVYQPRARHPIHLELHNDTGLSFTVRAPLAQYLIQTYRAVVDPDRESIPEHLLMAMLSQPLPPDALWDQRASRLDAKKHTT
ncbi:hypothetical protein [Dyella tabacisoli]|uniref:hypothetical protein n=1 Tax=Dyella tabacisoli TaxID=2282381 RepID=UPI0013B3C5FB|nr:hypothetical protein [Dyella tabacisoli]